MPAITNSKLSVFEIASAMLTFVASIAIIAFFTVAYLPFAPNLVDLALGFTFGTFLTMICGLGRQLIVAVTASRRAEPQQRGVWLPPIGALSTFFGLAVAGLVWVLTRQGTIGLSFGIGALVGTLLAQNGIICIGKKKCIVSRAPAIAEFSSIRIFMGDPQQIKLPHIVAEAEGKRAVFSIEDREVVEGRLSHRKRTLTEAWLAVRGRELLKDWKLATAGKRPFRILGLQ